MMAKVKYLKKWGDYSVKTGRALANRMNFVNYFAHLFKIRLTKNKD